MLVSASTIHPKMQPLEQAPSPGVPAAPSRREVRMRFAEGQLDLEPHQAPVLLSPRQTGAHLPALGFYELLVLYPALRAVVSPTNVTCVIASLYITAVGFPDESG